MLHMKNSRIRYFCAAILLASYAVTVNANPSEKTHLSAAQSTSENYATYAAYLEQDKVLNNSFKTSSRMVNKDNLKTLRLSQRKWIKWRDSTCFTAQAKANRQLKAYGTSVRDDCLTVLTEQRNEELLKFVENLQEAVERKFDFSRKNEYEAN